MISYPDLTLLTPVVSLSHARRPPGLWLSIGQGGQVNLSGTLYEALGNPATVALAASSKYVAIGRPETIPGAPALQIRHNAKTGAHYLHLRGILDIMGTTPEPRKSLVLIMRPHPQVEGVFFGEIPAGSPSPAPDRPAQSPSSRPLRRLRNVIGDDGDGL